MMLFVRFLQVASCLIYSHVHAVDVCMHRRVKRAALGFHFMIMSGCTGVRASAQMRAAWGHVHQPACVRLPGARLLLVVPC